MRVRPHRFVLPVVAALLLAACAPDGAPPPAAMVDSVDDLGAVRLRSFNLGKSINKGLGQATGAIEGGVNDVGGAFSAAFAEASNESSKAGRTAMSSVVSTAEHEWLPAGAMPSQAEIRRFMASGAKPEYTGKRPETVILALKGYARMGWQDVAAKFDRYYSQEG
jgi:hypothetical protein